MLLDLRAQDNKDRWLLLWNSSTGKLDIADRQRDEAWIAGPGLYNRGWINATQIWFQSESSGYSHLYTFDVQSRAKKAITQGNYEVQDVVLSADKKTFYITTNEVHPGEKQFYRIPVSGGKAERLTTMEGSNTALLSPDEKNIVLLYLSLIHI